MGVHRTCSKPDEIKKNTHPENNYFRSLCRDQVRQADNMFPAGADAMASLTSCHRRAMHDAWADQLKPTRTAGPGAVAEAEAEAEGWAWLEAWASLTCNNCRYTSRAVQSHPDGGSIRFRPPTCTHDAPPCGPSARAGVLT